ncbi:lipase [Terrimonas sp.]|uniref:lipase family protein n=1 Tax=Terrimonas sp. TaxID=1914338 RepID=UPI000D5239B9|nr:lipase family protein [Terrimonas sp.]PVD52438.1 lipase [Terrimonas sp.]
MNFSKIAFILYICFCCIICRAFSQHLQPGFDKQEYIETLKINQKVHLDTAKWAADSVIASPEHYHLVYRSPKIAFDNAWDLWMNNEKPVALIAARGTIATEASFLANFYAAMIPAKGQLELDTNLTFDYELTDNPNAAVHVGWFVAMAYMSSGVVHKIDSCYKAGIKDFILTGHSQGGGITYLLNAYLHSLQQQQKLPADITFKTYCSAAPKPGNLFFAYAYENMNSGGWAFNVANTADWVVDVPFSVQTVDDFTEVNPFTNAKTIIKKQKFPKNLVLRHVYNRLSKPSKRAQRNYQRYLGKMVSKTVGKQLPSFRIPEYYKSNYYVRTGNTIVLYADSDYYSAYKPETGQFAIWQHHQPYRYLYLAQKLP